MTGVTIDRRTVKQALRQLGLSSRQTEALLREGWRGLVGAREAELQELRDRLTSLEALAVETAEPRA